MGINKKIQPTLIIILVLLAGFILRLKLAPVAYHSDLATQAEWGDWMVENGYRGFYEYNRWVHDWPTYPPLILLLISFANLIYHNLTNLFASIGQFIALNKLAPTYFLWWFNFTAWFTGAEYSLPHVKYGFVLVLKFFAILSDILIAGLIYLLAWRVRDIRSALSLSILYLFLPFSWFLSSIWGQSDQLVFLLLIISFLLLHKRYFLLSPFLYSLTFNIKPTTLIFLPLFIWIYLLSKPKLWEAILGLGAAVGFTLYTISLFATKPILEYAWVDVAGRLFFSKDAYIVKSGFNFWHILLGDNQISHHYLSYKLASIIGFLLTGFFYLISLVLATKKSLAALFASIFISGTAAWLFMVNMYERYMFFGLVAGLFLVIYYPKFLKSWIILSIIFWLGLYYRSLIPESLYPLQQFLDLGGGIVTRILAFINVVIFLLMVPQIVLKIFNSQQIQKD